MLDSLAKVLGSNDTRGKRSRIAPAKPSQKKAPAVTRVTSTNLIADAILASRPINLTRIRRTSHAQLAASWQLSSPFIKTEVAHSNAFLFGVISDRMMKAQKAWQVPFELSKRLGHLDVGKIALLGETELEGFLRKPTNLHRFNAAMAKAFIAASKYVVANHKGAALNMWPAGRSAPALIEELEALPGISHKLSAMTLQILITQMGIDIKDMKSVNIAVDRHVARVFLRTGLVEGEPNRIVYRAGGLKKAVIEAAKKASPTFPAALDFATFDIGQTYCTHTAPRCTECPIRKVCPQKRKDWAIGVQKGEKFSAE